MDLADQKISAARAALEPSLPDRLRCLLVTTSQRSGAWLAEALAADRGTRVDLEEAAGAAEGLARLGQQSYDAVLLCHLPGELDALELVEGLRAGGNEEPLVILGAAGEDEMAPLCYEVGADAYVAVPSATTRGLLWVLARAVERRQLLRDNRRLEHAERHRLEQERRDVERLLAEQRAMLPAGRRDGGELPEPVVNHYRELLRAHVMMGSGNLGQEIAALAELLVRAGVSCAAALRMHTDVLDELLRGLGNRSSRHVMSRADLLLVELLLRLGEGYRAWRAESGSARSFEA